MPDGTAPERVTEQRNGGFPAISGADVDKLTELPAVVGHFRDRRNDCVTEPR